MPLNRKVEAEIDRQVAAGLMPADYAPKLKETLKDATDEFQAGFLAGPDYQRQSQENAEQIRKWKEWDAQARPAYEQAQAKLTEYERELAEYKARVAAGGGGEGAPAVDLKAIETAILDKVKSSGFITKEEHEKTIAQAKLDAIGFMGQYQDQLDEVQVKFRAAFGRDMLPQDKRDLIATANAKAQERGANVSLDEAFQLKHGPAMIENIKKAEYERGVKEAEARLMIPGGGGGTAPGAGGATMGPLQQRLQQTQGKDFTATDGDLQAAKAAAVEKLMAAH